MTLDINKFNKKIYEQFKVKSDPVVWQGLDLLKGTDLMQSGIRYGAFSQMFQKKSSLPIEYLLPRVEVHYKNSLPKTMESADFRYLDDPVEALRLSQMHWGYYFYLGGGYQRLITLPL